MRRFGSIPCACFSPGVEAATVIWPHWIVHDPWVSRIASILIQPLLKNLIGNFGVGDVEFDTMSAMLSYSFRRLGEPIRMVYGVFLPPVAKGMSNSMRGWTV